MVDANVIAAKLAELAERVSRVRAQGRQTADELAADRDALELTCFNLMLAVQLCADIASHIIADEGWPPGRNLAEGFQRLADHGVVDAAVTVRMQKAVGLRNVVAHGYGHVDVPMVHAAATAGLGDLDAFARQVGAWTKARSSET